MILIDNREQAKRDGLDLFKRKTLTLMNKIYFQSRLTVGIPCQM